MAKPIPQRLKKLESSDLLSIKDNNGDFLVVTKRETVNIVRDFIRNEVVSSSEDFITEQRELYEGEIERRFSHIEKSIDALIEHKFDLLSEKICDILITRKFNEEVVRKAEELTNKKKTKGKF